MAISYGATGITASLDTASPYGTTTYTLPSSHQQYDLLIAFYGGKPYNTVPGTPTDYTAHGGGANGTTANGAGTGSVYAVCFTKEHDGSESNPTSSYSAGYSPAIRAMLWVRESDRVGGSWTVTSCKGSDSSSTGTTYSATGDATLNFAPGDVAVVSLVHNDDSSGDSNFGLSIPGCTITNLTQRLTGTLTTSTGNDGRMYVLTAEIESGTASGAPTVTATTGSNDSDGQSVFLRLQRPVCSYNTTASLAATASQLVVPVIPVPVSQLQDTFTSSLDTAKWDTAGGVGTPPYVSGGQLVIPGDTWRHDVYTEGALWLDTYETPTAPAAYGFNESSVYAKVTIPTVASGDHQDFMVSSLATRFTWAYYFQVKSDNHLYAHRKLNYSDNEVADIGAYSSTTHAYLRLRHTSGYVYWDTSPDGNTWTNQASYNCGAADYSVGAVSFHNYSASSDMYVDAINFAPVVHSATVSLSATAHNRSGTRAQYGQQNAEDQEVGTDIWGSSSTLPNVHPDSYWWNVPVTGKYANAAGVVSGSKSWHLNDGFLEFCVDTNTYYDALASKIAFRGYFTVPSFGTSSPVFAIWKTSYQGAENYLSVDVKSDGYLSTPPGIPGWSWTDYPLTAGTTYRLEVQGDVVSGVWNMALYQGHSLTPLRTGGSTTGTSRPLMQFIVGADDALSVYWDDLEWTWNRDTAIGPNRSIALSGTAALTADGYVVKNADASGLGQMTTFASLSADATVERNAEVSLPANIAATLDAYAAVITPISSFIEPFDSDWSQWADHSGSTISNGKATIYGTTTTGAWGS